MPYLYLTGEEVEKEVYGVLYDDSLADDNIKSNAVYVDVVLTPDRVRTKTHNATHFYNVETKEQFYKYDERVIETTYEMYLELKNENKELKQQVADQDALLMAMILGRL